MNAGELADKCANETGAARMHGRAKEIAMIAIACATPDMPAWKRQIRKRYREQHPECGSVFILVVLPILVSLIAQWLGKWLFHRDDMKAIQSEARSACGWSPE
jgi:hypothetical protein